MKKKLFRSHLTLFHKLGITCSFLFFCSNQIIAQGNAVVEHMNQYNVILEKKIDSLKGLIPINKSDELKNIRNIIRVYRNLDNDSALAYSNKELKIAQEMGDIEEIATAKINAANLLNQLGEFERAKNALFFNLREKNRINDTLMARTRSALSNIFISTEEYDKSIAAGIAAAETFEILKDSSNAGFSYISIAEVYSLALDNEEEGIEYIKKAILLLSAKSADKEYLIAALLTYGDLCALQKDYDNTLSIYLEAKQIAVNYNEYWYYPDIMTKLGEVYYFRKEYDKSIAYLEQAGNRLESNGTSQALRYEYLGLNYRDLNQPKKAISYFNLCLEHEYRPRQVYYYKEHLVACYLQISDYETAFNIQREITANKEAINQSQQKEKVTEIIEKYENEKNEQEIARLSVEKELQNEQIRQQRLIWYGTIAFFIILFGFGIYLYWNRTRLKEARRHLETSQLQQRFLRTQLNPHFFFHALTSIEAYIYSNDKEKAAGFLHNFSRLMRNILEFSDVDFIPLQNDIDFIEKYVKLQQLSHDFKFDYQIHISPDLDPETIFVPPMLIQPVVENAILHGALTTESGLVKINYVKENEHVKITVEDNGKKTEQAPKLFGKLHRSMSTDITKKRIENLFQTHRMRIVYNLFSGENGQAEKAVVFSIPIKNNP